VATPDDPARDPEAFIARVRERALKYNGPLISDEKLSAYKRQGRK
jgi:hypothetical protein